jgi:scyllo-inositol 2-dehydrogenase (NADP+)
MTSLGVVSADPSSPLAQAVLHAPWRESAGLSLTEEGAADALLVVMDAADDGTAFNHALARADGRPVLLVLTAESGAATSSAAVAGVRLAGWTRRHDTRLRPIGLDPRGEGDLDLIASWATASTEAGVTVLATANQAFADYPVITWNAGTRLGVLTVGGEPATWSHRRFLRLIRRWIDQGLGRTSAARAGVGLLAFGAIGAEHAEAATAVPGLDLVAVCDRSTDRLDVATALHPGVATTTDADALLSNPDVDIVVISTPPDSHASWALRALEAGKHVVLEKPMALTAAECDKAMLSAAEHDRLVVVYQNRRYDSDFVTLRQAVQDGRIGTVFHTETFVGGYGHPCNYWHSDAAVSGGAIFDWGSHFIDQILQLLPGELVGVSARNHKLRWHDVTNADHARVTLHYRDGAEATFIHSDLAAATKPKYYVLGTEGAVVGNWRTERVVSRTAIGTAQVDTFAPADAPADLDLIDEFGSVTRLAPRPSPSYAFHRDLADRVLDGLPMEVTAEQSRRVVAVMEAAELSASTGGGIVQIP